MSKMFHVEHQNRKKSPRQKIEINKKPYYEICNVLQVKKLEEKK